MSTRGHSTLVSRQEVLERLTGILGDHSAPGAIVVGAAGMGKTELASRALSLLAPAADTVRIHPSATLAEVRFGALAPYLGSVEDTTDVMGVLRELVDVLPRRAKGSEGKDNGRPLLVVEDAHFLDPASRFVLSQLVQTSAVRLLALSEGTMEAEVAADSALSVGQLPVLVLDPMGVDEVRVLCTEVLGGDVAAGTAQAVTSLAAGNPLMIRVWLGCAVEQGALVRSFGVWTITRTDPQPNEEMRELVRGLHARLGLAQQETMELLALAGPLPRATISAVTTPGSVAELLASGAATVDRGGLVRSSSDLYADVLGDLVPPGRSCRLLGRWRGVVGKDALANHRQIMWAVECGEQVSAEILSRAVRKANNVWEPRIALHLCQVLGYDSTVVLETARAMLELGRPRSALSEVERVLDGPCGATTLHAALALEISAMWQMGTSPTELNQLADAWEHRAVALGARDVATVGTDRDKALWAGIEILRFWGKRLGGTLPPSAAERLEELRNLPGTTAENRLLCTLLLSDFHWMGGRPDTAASLTAEAWAALGTEPELTGSYSVQIIGRHALSLVSSGRYTQAEEFLDSTASPDPSESVRRQGTRQAMRGMLHMYQGRLAEATDELREGAASLTLTDPMLLLPLAVGLLELLNVETVTYTDSADEQTEPLMPACHGPYDLWLLARAFSAAAGATLAEDSGTAEQPAGHLSLLDTEAHEKGLPLVLREIRALACLREPNSRAFQRLGEAADTVEGPRSLMLGKVARCSEADHANRLETAAGYAEESGAVALAAELLARAVLLRAERGEGKFGGQTLRRLHLLTRGLGELGSRNVVLARSHGELTSREEDIVSLAVDGNNNRQIAKLLTLSQRTVEGHLYRIYSKLGISERSQLADFR